MGGSALNIKLSNILSRFSVLADIDEGDREKWQPICLKSLRQIKTMLKSADLNSEDTVRVEDACAMLAFYNYVMLMCIREDKSFSAGDVSITKNDNACKFAYDMWIEAKASISDLLDEGRFSFRIVRYDG